MSLTGLRAQALEHTVGTNRLSAFDPDDRLEQFELLLWGGFEPLLLVLSDVCMCTLVSSGVAPVATCPGRSGE